MILPIYLYGTPVLRAQAHDIDSSYPDLDKLIENMKETMYASEGIGIAAPQVGLDIKVVYIDASCLKEMYPELENDATFVLINPEITVLHDGKKCSREEGCLSVPGIHESVTRVEKINLKWLNEKFEPQERVIEGYLARVVQHECDHLNGTMFVDHLSPIRKQLIRRKLHDIIEGKARCDYKSKGVKKNLK